jgi:hypothetical protein
VGDEAVSEPSEGGDFRVAVGGKSRSRYPQFDMQYHNVAIGKVSVKYFHSIAFGIERSMIGEAARGPAY